MDIISNNVNISCKKFSKDDLVKNLNKISTENLKNGVINKLKQQISASPNSKVVKSVKRICRGENVLKKHV